MTKARLRSADSGVLCESSDRDIRTAARTRMECQDFEKDARQGAIREKVVTKAHCVSNKYLLNTYCVPV